MSGGFPWLTAAVVLVTVSCVEAQVGLPLKKECGQKVCQEATYCSEFDNRCRNCSDVCEQGHNYQPNTCQTRCQDYIHDQRYVRKGEQQDDSLTSKLDQLYLLGCLGLVLLLLILLTLWSKELYLCFKKRKCNKFFYSAKEKKLAAIKVISSNNQTTDQRMGYRAEGLKLEMPPPQDASVPRSVSPSQYPTTPATASTPLSRHHNHHNPHTSTPLSRPRHPTEDATLDYAYDNPALSSSSPVLDKQGAGSGVAPRQESSF